MRLRLGFTSWTSASDIKGFAIVAEGSSAANVRRVEALTGPAAIDWFRARSAALDEAAALLRTRDAVSKVKTENEDQAAGVKIVVRALEQPMREIARNAGDEPSVVINKVSEGKGNFGYNAQTGEYGDLVSMGVLDPTKVTRYALQNAASVAALILTTDAMVAELPKDEKQGGGMPGGGMGGMGDMDM